eukprot:CAMPEP_0203677068 /NCGR_PEP_ID=MMETSP0090-20130426/27003_1 /ASSEMBLY_ACC=CAM_ASM_001088 /TAXON_ID=426623 /ORGANISM="Chaetoceros affinis, Strain CCMP159" /LENGTH=347 /DNA_ID=CAMNT_0050543857 /DNA_START=44 /DNA_END=1088 /DNA_ORIENTATION=+
MSRSSCSSSKITFANLTKNLTGRNSNSNTVNSNNNPLWAVVVMMNTIMLFTVATTVDSFSTSATATTNARTGPMGTTTTKPSPFTSRRLLTNMQRFMDSNHIGILNSSFNTTTLCESNTATGTAATSKYINKKIDMNNPSSYYYQKMEEPPRSMVESHAIFGPLKKKGHVERYNVYRLVPNDVDADVIDVGDKRGSNNSEKDEEQKQEIAVADIRFGKYLNGHDGIVHGGIISLLLDDAFGWGYEAMERFTNTSNENDNNSSSSNSSPPQNVVAMAVTANLNVDYRNPLPAESDVVVRIYHDRSEGRKVYLSARMESYDGSVLYSEATALYIKLGVQVEVDRSHIVI